MRKKLQLSRGVSVRLERSKVNDVQAAKEEHSLVEPYDIVDESMIDDD